MPISKKIEASILRSSFIREMFEEGIRLKAQFGADNVYDFSLGNPDLPPPQELNLVIRELNDHEIPGVHGYMPNAGWPDVRAKVAEYVSSEYKKKFADGDIVMTCGAGGALNVMLKSVLDPGDEVIVPKPCFMEYSFYVDNHGGQINLVETNQDFTLNLNRIEESITPKTRVVLLNSPHNPTGVVYPESDIQDLCHILEKANTKNHRPIILISDEPYRKIVYDDVVVPSIFTRYPYVVALTSFSKDLSLPGERIGYIAVHPEMPNKDLLLAGLILSNRILGFVNASSLMQRAVSRLLHCTVDVDIYRQRRDLFVKGLKESGYEVNVPQGAFYLFPKSPLADDVAFIRELQQEKIIVVPGTGFGAPGYFRIAYCQPKRIIEQSISGFRRARERLI